jgi:hypothetical protein
MEIVTQITAILPNRRGALADLLDVLGRGRAAVRALCLTDTAEYGLARFVADDPAAARTALDRAGIPCAPTPVILCPAAGPAALAGILRRLAEGKAAVQYAYASGDAFVLGCPDHERALRLLQGSEAR